jgi:hypothetical protein
MDDLELEARLRSRLHNRFDEAQVPRELATSVSQAITTSSRRVGFDLRARDLQFGWPAVAAVAVITVAILVAGVLGGPMGPGARQSASPAPSIASQRAFIVLSAGNAPDKAVDGAAADILQARMVALGVRNFTSGVGYGIEFYLPADGPSDDAIRAVLGATGDVRFVPLPPADYGDGKLTAVIGQPLPKDEPALFDWEGIESVVLSTTLQGIPAVTVTLRPTATSAFAAFTAAHSGEYIAILVDGRVAALPVINEPIPGGQVEISGGGFDDGTFGQLAAIMVGGMLPEAWRGAEVPEIISKDAAIAAALSGSAGTMVESADLDAIGGQRVGELRAVWLVELSGPEGTFSVQVDAVTGSPVVLPIPASGPTPNP